MPTKPPPPDRRCRGHKRDGSACGQWAMRGTSVCQKHGGMAPQVRAKAEWRLAQEQVRLELARINPDDYERKDPGEELMEQLHVQSCWEAYLRDEVAHMASLEQTDMEGKRPQVLMVQWTQASERVAHYSELALRAGVDERRIRIAERDGRRFFEAVMAGLADPRFGLTDEQVRLGRKVFAEHLRKAVEDQPTSPFGPQRRLPSNGSATT